MKKIVILGAGQMGLAMSQIIPSKHVVLCGHQDDANAAIVDADWVIFAVKPQDFDTCAEGLDKHLKDKLIISIMAGISVEALRVKTGSKQIVRAMPNLALKVGESMTAWLATPGVKEKERNQVQRIFQAFGKELEVEYEEQLDSITAISGAGPAYFFALTEVLSQQAVEWGFPPEQAELIAEQTLIGAGRLLGTSVNSAKDWRLAVSSKGGATEAALKTLKEKDLDGILKATLAAAKKRAQELNQ